MKRALTVFVVALAACGPQLEVEHADDVASIESALAGNAIRRPHWGSARHGEAAGTVYSSGKFPDWGAWKWPGCHSTVGYFIDPSIPAGWRTAVSAAFATWDVGTRCSPHWIRATAASGASVVIKRSSTSVCDPTNDPNKIWYACAALNSGNSTTFAQHWTITFNTDFSPGVGVVGALDVQSLLTVELAHTMHMGHNPNWNDSVSQANAGRWGDYVTSAGNTGGEVSGSPYTVCASDSTHTCSYRVCPTRAQGGCGNYRTLRTGDTAFIGHLYAARATGCTAAGQTTSCTKCCGAADAGSLSRTCSSTHTWVGTCTMPVTDAGVADAGMKGDAGVKSDAGVGEDDGGSSFEEDDGGFIEQGDGGFDEREDDAGMLVPIEEEPIGTPEDGVTMPAETRPAQTVPPVEVHTGCNALPAAPFMLLAALLLVRRRGSAPRSR